MHAVFIGGDVDIDQVTLLDHGVIGDAVANYFVE